MKGQDRIPSVGWWFVDAAAGLLAPTEREVVLGDLAETDRGMWRGLRDVLGLASRRQLALWRSWRPWAASFGLALPASLFLMGWSVATSGAVASLLGGPAQVPLLWLSFSRLFLVISWAWMAGFAVAVVSRGTLWASGGRTLTFRRNRSTSPARSFRTLWAFARRKALRNLFLLTMT